MSFLADAYTNYLDLILYKWTNRILVSKEPQISKITIADNPNILGQSLSLLHGYSYVFSIPFLSHYQYYSHPISSHLEPPQQY
jgi:hypothetical protein